MKRNTAVTARLTFSLCAVLLAAACGGGGSGRGEGQQANAPSSNSGEVGLARTLNTTTWTQIATEGSTFTVPENSVVRYGDGLNWVTKTVSGTGDCTNWFFGNDPTYGVYKECDLAGEVAAGTPTWTKVATEGESFSVAINSTVRYGTGESWTTRTVSGITLCTNEYFGEDPAWGVIKECDVAVSVSSPAPPPAASGTATLTWNPSTDPKVTGYRVYYGTGSGSYWQAWGQGQETGNATTYVIAGLQSGETYYFVVTAIDGAGNESVPSNEATKQMQ